MSSELQRQSMLIDDFKAEYHDAMGVKQNSGGFISGFADLKLASIETGTWEFEIKYWKVLPGRSVVLPLTALQREYGRRCIKAGINWGWVAIFKDGVGNIIVAGDDPNQEKVDRANGFRRSRGGKWTEYNPIKQIRDQLGS